jgi:hypothetical protein
MQKLCGLILYKKHITKGCKKSWDLVEFSRDLYRGYSQ